MKKKGNKNKGRMLSQEFCTILDAIPDALLLLSPDLNVQWANMGSVFLFRRDKTEIIGRHCYNLWHDKTEPCDNCHALKSFITGEICISQRASPDGRWVDSRVFPIRDDAGIIKNVIMVIRDITEKIRIAEESRLVHAKLIHANKMATIGNLVSSIAHEINNPNNMIMFNSQMISDVWNDAIKILNRHHLECGDFMLGGLPFTEMRDIIPRLFAGINEGSVRIKNIIDEMKDYVRQGSAGFDRNVDINNVIAAAISIIDSQIKKYTDNFRSDLNKDLPEVRGNSQLLEQVIINLLMNALQALQNRGQGVRIATEFDSKHVIIKVVDEGIGMTEDILKKIGEPFFTTKLESGGTGLGLSISLSIIKDHNGTIEFDSEPGKGTTAIVRLLKA